MSRGCPVAFDDVPHTFNSWGWGMVLRRVCSSRRCRCRVTNVLMSTSQSPSHLKSKTSSVMMLQGILLSLLFWSSPSSNCAHARAKCLCMGMVDLMWSAVDEAIYIKTQKESEMNGPFCRWFGCEVVALFSMVLCCHSTTYPYPLHPLLEIEFTWMNLNLNLNLNLNEGEASKTQASPNNTISKIKNQFPHKTSALARVKLHGHQLQ